MDGDMIGGRYRLVDRLGSGGMSEVWRAEDEELERTVAVKLLRPDADDTRFEREARAVAALSHPNINHLYDYGKTDDGRPYMVLEYLSGGTLDERLVPGTPFPDEATAQVATDVAAGLAHAHTQGLVHRDLKPANVLFDSEDRAKLADFGIARLGGAGTLTEAGTVLGTANYISPEQASGEPATPASDVYSFGVILFRLLTGRLPFEGDDALAVATMHATQPAPSVGDLRPDAPAALEALTAAALSKRPEDRPPDGTAFLRELAAAAPTTALTAAAAPAPARMIPDRTEIIARAPAAAPGPAATVPPRRPPPRPPRRRGPLGALVALALLGAAGVALAVIMSGSDSSSTPTTSSLLSLSLPSAKHRTTTSATTTASTTAQTTSTKRTTTKPTTTRQITPGTPGSRTLPPTTVALPPTTATVPTAPPTTAPPPTLPTTGP